MEERRTQALIRSSLDANIASILADDMPSLKAMSSSNFLCPIRLKQVRRVFSRKRSTESWGPCVTKRFRFRRGSGKGKQRAVEEAAAPTGSFLVHNHDI